jgi:hypothetical protein
MGTAVTVGSGVTLTQLYAATGAKGKIMVGGTAATVVAAGGYVQGAGHSALGPMLGLAADNCLGELLTFPLIELSTYTDCNTRVQDCCG